MNLCRVTRGKPNSSFKFVLRADSRLKIYLQFGKGFLVNSSSLTYQKFKVFEYEMSLVNNCTPHIDICAPQAQICMPQTQCAPTGYMGAWTSTWSPPLRPLSRRQRRRLGLSSFSNNFSTMGYW